MSQTESNLVYRAYKKEDYSNVKEFLIENYYPHVPILQAVGLTQPSDEQQEVILQVLDLGCTTVCVNDSSEIVGIRIAYPRKFSDIEKPDENESGLGKILTFVHYLAVKSKVYELYNSKEIVNGMALCVAENYRGRGIGFKLYQENMKLAKDLGYKVYNCDCTSFYSIAICEKLGMTELFKIKFSDYVYENGKQILDVKKPHVETKVFAQVL